MFATRTGRQPGGSKNRRGLEHSQDEVAVMHTDRVRKGLERVDSRPRPAASVRMDRPVVADDEQVAAPRSQAEEAFRLARLAAVLPPPRAFESVHVTGPP